MPVTRSSARKVTTCKGVTDQQGTRQSTRSTAPHASQSSHPLPSEPKLSTPLKNTSNTPVKSHDPSPKATPYHVTSTPEIPKCKCSQVTLTGSQAAHTPSHTHVQLLPDASISPRARQFQRSKGHSTTAFPPVCCVVRNSFCLSAHTSGPTLQRKGLVHSTSPEHQVCVCVCACPLMCACVCDTCVIFM